jgi:hypothetical protein
MEPSTANSNSATQIIPKILRGTEGSLTVFTTARLYPEPDESSPQAPPPLILRL